MKKAFWRRCLVCLLAAALRVAGAPPAAARLPDLAAEIEGMTAELTRISGLRLLDKVRYEQISREEVARLLEERVQESLKPEELRVEELALKRFGFVPADFDLKKITLEVLSEQAAAFYDFKKKKLFLVEAESELTQRSALVHELAHVLADQHFHLERFIEGARQDDDRTLARLATMEGQATWLMYEYLAQQTGQSLKRSPALVKTMSQMTEISAAEYPALKRAPLYLRETLLFPYTQGLLFQQAVVEKLGQAAFAEVFRRPPASSQQILHPEKYLAGVKPLPCSPPAPADRRNYRTLADGSIGELDHAILLRQYVTGEAAQAVAPAWRGGSYQLLEQKGGQRVVLAYASQWGTPAAAQHFFRHYRQVLQGKWKRFEAGTESAASLEGRGDDGYFLLRRTGSKVTSLEGLERPEAAAKAARAIHYDYSGGALTGRLLSAIVGLGFSLPLLAGAEVPRPAPEFVIKLPNGRPLLLSSFRGKVVALEVLMTTCPYCKTCSAIMNKLYKEYGPRGFQALGVAFNPMAAMLVPDYAKELQLNFPVGVAEREPVLGFLQQSPLERMLVPQLIFIDRKGVIRAQHSGDSPFFADEEKSMREQIEALLKEPAGRKTPGAKPKKAASKAASTAAPPL